MHTRTLDRQLVRFGLKLGKAYRSLASMVLCLDPLVPSGRSLKRMCPMCVSWNSDHEFGAIAQLSFQGWNFKREVLQLGHS